MLVQFPLASYERALSDPVHYCNSSRRRIEHVPVSYRGYKTWLVIGASLPYTEAGQTTKTMYWICLGARGQPAMAADQSRDCVVVGPTSNGCLAGNLRWSAVMD